MSEKSSKKLVPPAHAIHLQVGANHLFGVGNIHVVVTEADDGWFAQGIEIDYYACGADLDDVQSRFTKGLIATIEENIRRTGSFERVLKWAPDAWAQFQERARSEQYTYQMLNSCQIDNPVLFPPIQYLKEERKQAA